MKLTNDNIEEICKEIETQWEYHLMTRAIFYSSFPRLEEYFSPKFYADRGFEFKVKLPELKSESFNRASEGVGVWLNQNYVIRLFGILDSKKLIKYGEMNGVKIIQLIKILRNNIGAHSTGRRVSKKKRSELRRATQLINELFGRDIELNNVVHFTLSVDSVLYPLKNQTINLIRELCDENTV